jgi:hypothetical protein
MNSPGEWAIVLSETPEQQAEPLQQHLFFLMVGGACDAGGFFW